MVPFLRNQFINNFTDVRYIDYLNQIDQLSPGDIDFRIAESPVFIPKEIKNKMLDACDEIIDVIIHKDFKSITENSIPEEFHIPGEDQHPQMIVFDFGICQNANGELEPQLIEMQGFPSLFSYQLLNETITRKYADVPDNYDSFLNGYDHKSYLQLLKEIIIGESSVENVILLEIYPELQKTKIDFRLTEKLLGISTVCLTQLIEENNQLFHFREGKKKLVKKIFNRIIFDDLKQYDLKNIIDLRKSFDVEWVPHPNWFYRISKFTLPFIENPFVPTTYFLNEITFALPLEEYVLKPLFSYAGMGVIIDVTQADIDSIEDPENWILQKKVNYAAIIQTLDEPAKVEIRLFYLWKKGWLKPIAIHNLTRLSKGKMIGTRYNEDKTWVGGTIAYFEK
jgi:hypothetical protein